MNINVNLKLYDWQEEIENYRGNLTIRGGRQTGKSLSVARRIYKFAMENPNGRSLIIAASERQENFIYERVRELIGKNYRGRSTLTLTTLKNGHQIIKFPVGITGKYLEGLSSIDFLYCDEAIHIWEKVWDSILPMIAEPRKRGLGWITMLSSTRGKPKGYFFKSFSDSNFKQIQVKAEDCEHISKEFLESEKLRLGERMYNVIYNGEFDEEANHYFPTEIIERAIKISFFSKKDIDKNKDYYLGIDPARYGKSKAAFCESEISKDKIRVLYGEELKKSSLTELKNKTLELQELFNNKKIFIDDGGFGAGLIDYLEEDKKIRKRLVAINNKSSGKDGKILKEDLYSNVLNLLSSEKIELINQKEIIEGLKGVEFEGPEGEEKILGTDMSEAIVRSCWGIKERYIKLRLLRF